MTDARANLLAAEAEAALARSRLSTTLTQLQDRLDPQSLVEDARRAGLHAAQAGVDRAKSHPAVTVGALAAAALLLGRHRLAGLFRKTKPDPVSIHREGMRP
jgi:ElaB/YqjD/DUF883 family membrane-anchored ribosome-binding protein